jgi:hypothetical protein
LGPNISVGPREVSSNTPTESLRIIGVYNS